MSENSFQWVRTSACIAGIVAVGLTLAGCAALGYGSQQSLKDDLSPRLTTAAIGAPAPTKIATVAAPRRTSPPAKDGLSGSSNGCGSDTRCLKRLKALLDDQERKWVGQPQNPTEHVDGTRQFAYRILRAKLSCKELTLAIDEIAAATKAFQAPVPAVASSQAAHVRALNGQVEVELRAERASRCAG
jgi:hypothetical protein